MTSPVKAIQHIVIDTTGAYTFLCDMGILTCADKTPYGTHPEVHRHPYTGVYSMLFAPLRFREIQFAEIGVSGGSSVVLWDKYFHKAKLCFFDRDENFLNNIDNLPVDNKPFKALMDVSKDGDVARALTLPGGQYDVILDDSSHEFNHQIRIIKEAFPLLKSGGYLIIEDVFRSTPEERYQAALEHILPQCAEAYFVVCNHEERYSPGWNNDKLLVLVKGAAAAE